MSDERERSDAAGDGGATDDAGRARTTLANRPQRPTGKRQRAAVEDGGAGVDVASTAVELGESGSDADGGKSHRAGKKAKKKSEGPSRNPVTFVYEYLKQVVAELRKVIWPNQKQMITYTSVVLAFLIFMVALIAGSDYGFAKLVLLVFGGER
ncbi:MAG TPA: preprotein translocase subunit SecE [Mycobacterium sp.]|nr:preprotein translocase subunit SecE [Mycobacterium sp.]